ncbi:hypothetical protein [Pseudomonas leptonychotis]|uniref:hypothetical protein n=1 Tax=Pseudomonas leptonychotis TaxID=2448482 RepID=UPI0039F0251E
MSSFIEIIQRKRNDLSELEVFASVCKQALNQATKAVESIDLQHRIASALNEPPPYESESDLELAKTRALKIAQFAEVQNSNDSPYLFSLCAVRLWALMEALVDEIVVESMQKPQDCPDQTILAKLKGPLIEFRAAPPDEQAEFLSETLKQAVDASLKLGVGRFEVLLTPLGFSGEVHETARKILYELSQIRNIIVHKSGKADRRIIEACPWLNLKRGETIHVTSHMFERYHTAAYWYIVEILGRVYERNGEHRPEQVKDVLIMLEELLDPQSYSE